MWKTIAIIAELILFMGLVGIALLWARLTWVMHKSAVAFSEEMAAYRARNLPGARGTDHAPRVAGATGTQPAARHRVPTTTTHHASKGSEL